MPYHLASKVIANNNIPQLQNNNKIFNDMT